MEYRISHISDRNRFETEVDGYTAHVVYEIMDGSLNIAHTFVPRPIENRGIAAALVKAAYSFALEENLKSMATCSYANMWLSRHPEYQKG